MARFFAAIDLMALILSERSYLIWAEKNHPHVPRVAEIQDFLAALPDEERRVTIAKVKALTDFSKNVQEAAAHVV